MGFGWSLHAKERKKMVIVSSFMRHGRQDCFNVYMLHSNGARLCLFGLDMAPTKRKKEKCKLSPSWACGGDLGPKRKEEKEKDSWASNRPKKERKESRRWACVRVSAQSKRKINNSSG